MSKVIQRTRNGGKIKGAPAVEDTGPSVRQLPSAKERAFRQLVERHTSDPALVERIVRDWREGRIKVTRAGKLVEVRR